MAHRRFHSILIFLYLFFILLFLGISIIYWLIKENINAWLLMSLTFYLEFEILFHLNNWKCWLNSISFSSIVNLFISLFFFLQMKKKKLLTTLRIFDFFFPANNQPTNRETAKKKIGREEWKGRRGKIKKKISGNLNDVLFQKEKSKKFYTRWVFLLAIIKYCYYFNWLLFFIVKKRQQQQQVITA